MRFMITQPVKNQPHYLRGYAKDGDVEWVRRLLKDGVNVNDKDEHGMTALHLAAAENHEDVVQILLNNGASSGVTNLNGQTPLHLIAANGHTDILKMLLDGLEKEILDLKAKKSGHTALHYASRHGHVDICRLLIDSGATKHIPDTVRLPPVKYAKNEETRKVFEEENVVSPILEKRRSLSVNPKPPSQSPATLAKPAAPSKDLKTRSRSKSSDPPRAPRSKDPSTQRQERALESKRNSINAAPNDHGQGEIKRNEVSIFSENISREKEEIGPVIVDKKAEISVKQMKDKKMTFSDAHKKRMQMSVFDRLAGGSKKK